MQGIVSGFLLVGAFGVVTVLALLFSLRLSRATRGPAPGESHDVQR
ncbi:MAG TPA: hypothetical protein VMV92_37635 [Streptosporangiaceae bacterium]|nr:hypothetical protein [Streptosporangiaceae bacterium]